MSLPCIDFHSRCVGFCREYFNEYASAEECIQKCDSYIAKYIHHVGELEGFPSIRVVLGILAGPLVFTLINYSCPKNMKKTVVFGYINRAALLATVVSCLVTLAYVTNKSFLFNRAVF